MVGNMKGDVKVLNKEKYAKEIVELATNGIGSIAIVNDKPCCCGEGTSCSRCDLMYGDCDELLKQWANSEYKEREIDWSKVPVDTPIYVWDNNDNRTYKRHFAGYNQVNNMIFAFDNRGTYWSSGATTTKWDNAKIKEGVDCSEWYKD